MRGGDNLFRGGWEYNPKDALRVKRVIEETRRYKKTQEDSKRSIKLQENQRLGTKFKSLWKVSFLLDCLLINCWSFRVLTKTLFIMIKFVCYLL